MTYIEVEWTNHSGIPKVKPHCINEPDPQPFFSERDIEWLTATRDDFYTTGV